MYICSILYLHTKASCRKTNKTKNSLHLQNPCYCFVGYNIFFCYQENIFIKNVNGKKKSEMKLLIFVVAKVIANSESRKKNAAAARWSAHFRMHILNAIKKLSFIGFLTLKITKYISVLKVGTYFETEKSIHSGIYIRIRLISKSDILNKIYVKSGLFSRQSIDIF